MDLGKRMGKDGKRMEKDGKGRIYYNVKLCKTHIRYIRTYMIYNVQ